MSIAYIFLNITLMDYANSIARLWVLIDINNIAWYGWLLIVFVGLVVLKFLLNWSKMRSAKDFLERYEKYVVNPSYDFHQHINEIKQLITDADIKDSEIAMQEMAAYGYVKQYTISLLDNLTLVTNEQVVGNMRSKFHQAIGEYRRRMKESYSPTYWLEFIFKMPEHVFKNFGVLPGNLASKLGNLIYWAMLVALGLIKADAVQWLTK